MYIFKNAFRCISRAKGRNFLIGLIVLLLSVSSCIGLSIKQANATLKKQYADDMEITATINSKNRMGGSGISIEALTELSQNSLVKNFYYTMSMYFAAGDNIEPLDVSGSFKKNKDFRSEYGDIKNGEQITRTETYSQNENAEQGGNSGGFGEMPEMPGGGDFGGGTSFITNNFFFNMASMNDFTVTGCNDLSALPEYVASLDVLSNDSEELDCVISKTVAEESELSVGDTFTLKNPNNEDEIYTFTIKGLADTSLSSDSQDTSSNASFTDNYIYISGSAFNKILSDSATVNAENETQETEDGAETKSNALSATYSGTFVFANLDSYNNFNDTVSENYSLVSNDVSNYEQSISQLETLGKYATYFLIVIFIIGAFVLIIINLFSIRNRKYEIGVLTAIGMKKYKVAAQFVVELFVVTFIALIIGSSIGSAVSVPVTNSLLITINTQESSDDNMPQMPDNMPDKGDFNPPSEKGDFTDFGGDMKQKFENFGGDMKQYVAQITTATDLTVILEMIIVGMGLTLISSIAAVTVVMRYEPLKILNNRD